MVPLSLSENSVYHASPSESTAEIVRTPQMVDAGDADYSASRHWFRSEISIDASRVLLEYLLESLLKLHI